MEGVKNDVTIITQADVYNEKTTAGNRV